MDWSDQVVAAERRIRSYVRQTPLEYSPYLSQLADARVFLKLECAQLTGSFKLRGAMNKLLSMTEASRRSGLVAASTGNHGLAVAYGLRELQLDGTIFLPRSPAPAKLDALRELGAQVELHGDDPEQTESLAREHARLNNQTFVSPYNDPDIVAGQGTVAVEIHRQLDRCDAVLASVGGGGLISGVGCYLKSVHADLQLVGCWPRNSPVLYECLRAGRIIEWPWQPTLSDATAGGVEPGAITFDLCRRLVDDYVLVDEDEIRAAVRLVAERHQLLIEGAAGVAVAAFVKRKEAFRHRTVVVILCGRNIGLDELRSCLC